jgi:(p)ppGpp synthase/HD superfamily hydrolase
MKFNFDKYQNNIKNENNDFARDMKAKIILKSTEFIDANDKYSDVQKEKFKEMIMRAVELALSIHGDQKPRPDGPYVNHILRVANRIIEEYGIMDPELIIAALFHDSVEDQSSKLAEMFQPDTKAGSERVVALEYLGNEFGDRVAKIILKLSNPEDEELDISWEEKNVIYKEHVKEIIKDDDVLPIKMSDFSDNGLNLNSVSDPERRLRLSRKYLPVMKVFTERLKSANNVFSEEKIAEISNRLLSAIDDTEKFIKNFENI